MEQLSELETTVLNHLHTRVEMILGKKHTGEVSSHLSKSVIIVCNVMYLSNYFADEEPVRVVSALRGLLAKKLVNQYEDNMVFSYVPVTYKLK